MRSFLLVLALAVPAVAASAAPTLTDPHPGKIATGSHRSQWVRMSFHNVSPQGQTLTIGENSYLVPVARTVTLSIAAGSTVQLSSPWNSHVNGQLRVGASDAGRTVILQ